MTYEALSNATSLQGLADGVMPCNSQDGDQIDLFGLAHVHANLSPAPESAREKTTNATSGLSSSISSASADLQSYLANRLLQLLATDGSMIYALTWKAKVTPAGRQYCQLAASARSTNGIDCGGSGWPTTTTRDYKDGHEQNVPINALLGRTAWPTPCCNDENKSRTDDPQAYAERELGREKAGTSLALYAQAYAAWPTPKASEAEKETRSTDGAIRELENRNSPSLTTVAVASGWATPNTMDHLADRSHQAMYEQARNGGRKNREFPSNLREQVKPEMQEAYQVAKEDAASGITRSGFTVETTSTGQLNPAFSRWLMGYPKEWCIAAIQAHRQTRTQPRKRGK